MAKQKGLAKFAGKIDDQSFYYSKNGGYQSRKINPGMSARVKTAAEYENTRKNNSEFGGAGACGGAIVRGISQRYRFILSPKATGMLVKAIKKVMVADTSSPWGTRIVQLADMPAVQDVLNQMSKNNFPDEVKSFIENKIKYQTSDTSIHCANDFFISAELAQEFSAKGATGLHIALYSYQVDTPQPKADGKGYEIPVSYSFRLSDIEGEVDLTTYQSDSLLAGVQYGAKSGSYASCSIGSAASSGQPSSSAASAQSRSPPAARLHSSTSCEFGQSAASF